MARLESQFQSELKKSFNHLYPDGFWLKIPDGIAVKDNLRFIPPKPCDVVVGIEGRSYAIELKAHKSHQSWSTTNLRPSQRKGLADAARAGWVSGVLILVRYEQQNIRTKFAAWMPHDKIPTGGSITVKALREYYQTIPRRSVNGRMVWDIRFLTGADDSLFPVAL